MAIPSRYDKRIPYHHLHVRIDLPIWRRVRELFPEYGHIRKVVNLALAQFIESWEDLQAKEREKRIGDESNPGQ